MEVDIKWYSTQLDFDLDDFLICGTAGPFLMPHGHCSLYLFVMLPFAFRLMVSNALHGYAGKCPTSVTCNDHLTEHLMEVDGNCLHVSA